LRILFVTAADECNRSSTILGKLPFHHRGEKGKYLGAIYIFGIFISGADSRSGKYLANRSDALPVQ
jgi:hypothetical protein